MSVEEKLKELGYELPTPPTPKGAYRPVTRCGDILFTSGTGANINGIRHYLGKVGSNVTLEEAQESARLALLNNLANIKAEAGTLEGLRILKLTGFVNSAPGFNKQPAVVDGASVLLQQLFGDNGCHARSAIGVAELPFDLSVEIEMVVTFQQ